MRNSIYRQIRQAVVRILTVVVLILLGVWWYIAQPNLSSSEPVLLEVHETRMIRSVRTLSEDFHPRSFSDLKNLKLTADYIDKHFKQAGGTVIRQAFEVSGRTYDNIIARFGNITGPSLIIGAHYDAHCNTPGADDNASGVAGLIELAYLFQRHPPSYGCVELAAYCLEEPPYFASSHMGSYHHAQEVADNNQQVVGMLCLEMIGYFSDAPNSQHYPSTAFELLYPNTGNFIAVIGKLDQRAFTERTKIAMKGATQLPIYSVNAPRLIPGIDFSDHRNFWETGHQAVMITDTAFYRNAAYHKDNDTWDRLDYKRMGQTIIAVYNAAQQLLEEAQLSRQGI